MFSRRLLRKSNLPAAWSTYKRNYGSQQPDEIQRRSETHTQLAQHRSKKPQRQPFVKNLFTGTLDTEFLDFPDPFSNDRYQEFFEWLKPVENYMSYVASEGTNLSKEEILDSVRDLNVLCASLGDLYGGLNFSASETSKLIETLSTLPWLSTYLVKNNIIPIHIIANYGTEQQKAKYLPKIASGELVPTVCLTEKESGSNINSIKAQIEVLDKDTLILNGEKVFVANGADANLFIVFAMSLSSVRTNKAKPMLSTFLVEREFGGITCTSIQDTIGQKDMPMCIIKFKDTPIPNENELSDSQSTKKILLDLWAPGKQNMSSQAVSILRNFLNLLIAHIIPRQHMDKNMYEFETVQNIISKIASSLYSMESVLYLTNAMIDTYTDQDVDVEKAITELLCATECVNSIYEGLQIIGAQSYLQENPFIKQFLDALSLVIFEGYSTDTHVYIALLGTQYAAKTYGEHIRKVRNPLFSPGYIMRNLFAKEHILNLYAADNLHPSMKYGADMLERCVTYLHSSTIKLLERNGTEIVNKQTDLCRLSEIAVRTYTLIATLARASRSYCFGVRNAEYERNLAIILSYNTHERIKTLATQIDVGEICNSDLTYKYIAEQMFDKKKYFAEHVLHRLV